MQATKHYRVGLILTIFTVGAFITVLNQTLLFTAFPKIMATFAVSASTVQWLTTAYMLVNGVLIPVTAFLIGRYTTRQLTLFAIGAFTIGTLGSGLATSFSMLLIARLIQAIGAGILVPLMQVVMFTIVDKNKRGSIMGLIGLATAFAPAIGPTLSGVIVNSLSWRFLFWLVLPIAGILLIMTIFGMQNVGSVNRALKLDYPSVLLSTLGFGLLLYGTGIVNQSSAIGLLLIVVGLGLIALFIHRQTKLTQPMLEFRVFKNRQFTLSLLLVVLSFIALMGPQTTIPTLIQSAMHQSALTSALVLLPGAIANGVAALIAGRLFDRFGGKVLAIVGSVVIMVSMVPYIFINTQTSLIVLSGFFILTMIGNSLIMMPLMTAGLNALPEHWLTHGTAMMNTFRQMGGSIGIGVLVSIQTVFGVNSQFLGARALFGGVMLVGIISLVMALMLDRQRH
ncbi:multidrug MFS transporter [Lactiplantibacillus fabifermentans T30PCM01]|uniref:Multidrug MFS transporter n=1 Tax=Lactiplantibacillus fabifermentans T30PCM01 TaxID=1400520 RepID=W6T3T7_9LACO|nr:MDR family MFS transporter [Lactiplantibacillus fabifermentans]ETY72566.1 multidrug MFS transporter [Lactiplantibacillus fabifermentans T30PCM01]